MVESVDGVVEIKAFVGVDAAVGGADFEVAAEDGAFSVGDEGGEFSGVRREESIGVGEMPGLGNEKLLDFKLAIEGRRSKGGGLGRELAK